MSGAPERQLVLDLAREPCFDRDDFLVSAANAAATAAVRAWPEWPSRTLLLVGPPGSGKSHLAAIWAVETGAQIVGGTGPSAGLWAGGGRCVVLEDCDRSAGAEVDLFHALNLVREENGWLLMTARQEPTKWGVATPDLLSRLRLATLATIEPPDDELMKSVLVKLFADRQIAIDTDVIDYAARHCDRSLEAANSFVATVDEQALRERRRITRPLAVSTLAAMRASDPSQGPT